MEWHRNAQGKKLLSILYFHRISDVRVGKRNLAALHSLVGEHAYPNIIIVTTRWNEVNGRVAEEREAELRTKRYLGGVVEGGAKMMRYARTEECTRRIVAQALTCPPVEVAVEQRIVRPRPLSRAESWDWVDESDFESLHAESVPTDDEEEEMPPGAYVESSGSGSWYWLMWLFPGVIIST